MGCGGESDADKEPVYSFDDPDLIQNRPALQRALVISAGVIFNMILSWSAIFASVSTIGITTPVVMPGVAVPGIADPNGAAAPSATDRAMAAPDGAIWAIIAAERIALWRSGDAGFEALPYVVAPR